MVRSSSVPNIPGQFWDKDVVQEAKATNAGSPLLLREMWQGMLLAPLVADYGQYCGLCLN